MRFWPSWYCGFSGSIFLILYPHCCMKCPQISREKTSSQNSQGITLRIQWHFFHQNYMASRNRFCRQYLQNINALIFWFKYLQKINAMPSDFWWKKKVLPLWQITFDPLKKRIKKYSSMEQNLFFFIRNLRALHLLFAGT